MPTFTDLHSLATQFYRFLADHQSEPIFILVLTRFSYNQTNFAEFLSIQPGFTGFGRNLTGFQLVLLGFTILHGIILGFYWVLPSFIRFGLVLSGFTGFYWVLLGFTGFYWVLLGFT